ncbi:hypothetical protein V6N13_057804 [Hibiscus sabdariffa]
MFFMLGISLSHLVTGNAQHYFDVCKFGAVGDGKTDDSPAFLTAWQLCVEQGEKHQPLKYQQTKYFCYIHWNSMVLANQAPFIFSIGSLGEDGTNQNVDQVYVTGCTFKGSTNGARIKTTPGGTGFARGVSFQGITLIASGNPIVIDQHYCNGRDHHCQDQKKAVAVSGVTFSGFQGTSSVVEAINLDCSKQGCRGITIDNEGVVAMFFMLGISLSHLVTGNAQDYFDVCKFGAVGDGNTDDSPVPISERPTALHFHLCTDLRLHGLTHLNSQKNHISIYNCSGVSISDLNIIAPSDSPNTDGIDIALSSQLLISNTFIGTDRIQEISAVASARL